jgi:hypothetical protein
MRGVALATAAMAAVMLGLRLALGDAEPAIVLATLLPTGAAVSLAGLWLLDRGLIRDVLQLAAQATPFRRSRASQAR